MLVSVWLTITVVWLVAVSPDALVMLTAKEYVPAWLKVATVFLAALVPLALKVTPPGPLTDHVYRRPASPAASAPSTLRAVVVPVTGLGVAVAELATEGKFSEMFSAELPMMPMR